jgi:leucyl aminopeptidase (aminopeptidase T)
MTGNQFGDGFKGAPMSALKEAALVALKKCLAVQPEDYVLVVTDEGCREIGAALHETAREMGAEAIYLEYHSRSNHGEEPPIGVAEIMREMDVVIAPTAKSLSNTEARRRACKAGARIATMPGVTADVLEHCLNVDVDAVATRVRELARMMHGRSEVHVTSDAGTDLRFSMDGSKVFQDTGMIRQPGDWGNLPAGKVSLAPAEGSARGDIVIDGAMFGGLLGDEILKVRVEGGRAVSVEGGEAADALNAIFEEHGDEAKTLAEFGLGAHENARLIGHPVEDEKVLGTIHIAFGNNRAVGGRVDVPVHETGIILNAKVTIDGRTLVEAGGLKI